MLKQSKKYSNSKISKTAGLNLGISLVWTNWWISQINSNDKYEAILICTVFEKLPENSTLQQLIQAPTKANICF